MGGKFSKASALRKKAGSDFAMAESYLKSRDYAAASAAYLSVIREVLRALSKGRAAGKATTEEIEDEVLMPKYVADAAEGSVAAYYSPRHGSLEATDMESASSTMEKRDAAKRLIDYVFAYMQQRG